MKTLILFFLFSYCISTQAKPEGASAKLETESSPPKMDLSSLNSEADIKAWGEKNLTRPVVKRFDEVPTKVAVLIGSVGSGIQRAVIYVFVEENGKWNPILTRYTNSSIIYIDKENAKLIFKSKSKTILMEVPLKSLSLFYDQNEQ